MNQHVVIGLDSSTQSTKAIAWDQQGRALVEGRAPVAMNNPGLGRFEQDPADWWRSAAAALRDCQQGLPAGTRVDGLAISNQRETIGFIGADGEAVHPSIVWLDDRADEEVARFNQRFDELHAAQWGSDAIHRITGRPAALTPCVYVLAWMQKHRPDVMRQTACFVDVQSYLVKKLCADEQWKTGWISADPMGMFDLENKCWSEPILQQLGISTAQLPLALAPGEQLGTISAVAAAATGLAEGVAVYAAGGDGQCAGLGTNCTLPDRAYINLGTAVVSGIWSPEYRYNRAWRTELAAQGHGYIFENCLRSGAFLLNWLVEQFGFDKSDTTVFKNLEAAARPLPIGADGLMVQPYWAGVMDPYWDTAARGMITGLVGSHTQAHIYRALLEGITLQQVMATLDMEAAAQQPISHYVAIGGGANSPLWRQMLADASGKAVKISPTVEASALGAGMIAASAAGWYDTIEQAAGSMSSVAQTIEPDPANAERYQELLGIYRDMYQSTAALNRRLALFQAAGRADSE